MHHVEKSQIPSRHMGRTFFPQRIGHQRYLHGTDHSSKIEEIGLHNLKSIIGNQPAKSVNAIFLFPSRNRDRKGIGNLFGLFIPVERYWLFKKLKAVLLQKFSYPNRHLYRIEAVSYTHLRAHETDS